MKRIQVLFAAILCVGSGMAHAQEAVSAAGGSASGTGGTASLP